jgi:integrase
MLGSSCGFKMSRYLSSSILNSIEVWNRRRGCLSEPKSERAKRELRIPQLCLMELLSHRETQNQEREWAGSKWQEGDFVFTTGLVTPMRPDDISRRYPTVLKAAKLPKVRFHDLCHSCTTLLSLGVHAKLIQETLGHSSYRLTMNTYSHMIPALRNEVVNRMDDRKPTPISSGRKCSDPLI